MKFFHFVLSHSIFIAFCAVALCLQTNILLQIPHNAYLYGLIFGSTVCSYNFYWLLSKYYFSGRKLSPAFIKENFSYLLLFFVSGTFMLFCLFKIPHLLYAVLVSVFLTLLYSLPLWPFRFTKYLQKWGFVKTLLLSFTWAFVTTIFPYKMIHNIPYIIGLQIALILLFISRFSFMVLLCILFDKRDTAIDKINGLRSIATDVSKIGLWYILIFVFAIFLCSSLYFCYSFTSIYQLLVFVLLGVLFWLLYALSLKEKGYVFYYFFVDGLMLLSGLLTYVASIL
jgi:4-hydroxybenzoate polyprenyltransferase